MDTILLIHYLTLIDMLFVIVDECNNIAISTHSNHESYLQLID